MGRLSSTSLLRAGSARWVAAALLVVSFVIYALTISHVLWTTDVYGANWTSWHIATTGSPWIDGLRLPDVGHRSDHLLAIVQTANGHTAFGRFPGVVIASLPTYLIASGSMSTVPGSLTAAFLTSCALVLLFEALRRYLTTPHALLATVLFGFATPVWTVDANLMWPHTITVLGIAGMAWAASTERWWWAGVFGGIALWGRLHVAVVIAILAVGVGVRRRDPRLVARAATTSSLFLLATCAWNHWVYGTWNPLGGYFTNGVSGAVDTAGSSTGVGNYLGMWIAPDRGILVWTPVVALLLPALARSWRHLPDWSRFLLVGGFVYTIVQSSLIGFAGGTGFYGYRYGLEFLACATPALTLSVHRVGRVGRVLIGPVLAVQAFAFLLGGLYENLYLSQNVAWHQNAFVHVLDRIGPAAWAITAVVAVAGFLVGRRFWQSPGPANVDGQPTVDEVPSSDDSSQVNAGR
jgi:hypothetical protein